VSVAAIVLAAGASRRLGRPKQEIVLGRETLLQRTIRVAQEAGLFPVIVVTRQGSGDPEINFSPQLVVAPNPDADEGIASSIRCGISEAMHHMIAGAVILTCDQPALRAAHLRALIEDQDRVAGSVYGGSVGVPAYFPIALFTELLHLRGDTGARALLKTAYAIEAEELNLDIDTERDLDIARALLEEQRPQD
jgi:molybdenum cofactor cytidylyltransferase